MVDNCAWSWDFKGHLWNVPNCKVAVQPSLQLSHSGTTETLQKYMNIQVQQVHHNHASIASR